MNEWEKRYQINAEKESNEKMKDSDGKRERKK